LADRLDGDGGAAEQVEAYRLRKHESVITPVALTSFAMRPEPTPFRRTTPRRRHPLSS
jgi:hypothetical protein